MSITSDLKSYADAAVETGRNVVNGGIGQTRTAVNGGLSQTRTAVNERFTKVRSTLDESIDGAGARAGSLTETATAVGTQALDRARYDVYAAVGAVDAVVTGVVTRLQELPVEVVSRIAKVQNTATDAADKITARFQDLTGTAESTVSDIRTGAIVDKTRETAEARRQRLEQAYSEARADLHARGEAVVTELRHDPRVQRVAGLVGASVATVEDAAAKPARRRSAEQAQETRARNERSARAKKAATTRARKATPAKATKKTTAKRTTKAAPARKASKATKATKSAS
ncbi:hypothetical protein ACXR2U_11610 [Jatrophihabitans sp. YIM 134969]